MNSRPVLFLALLLFSQLSFSFQLSSSPQFLNEGLYVEQIQLRCEANEELCFNICGAKDHCEKSEGICQDCSGTSSGLLRIIFTRLESYFTTSPEPVSEIELTRFLTTKDSIFISSRSVYNFYRPWNDPEIQREFQGLCPGGAQPLLAIELGSDHRPLNLVYAFCSPRSTETQVYKIELKANRGLRHDLTKENL